LGSISTGTQGRPLTISTTNVAQALYLAFALSEHDWQQRDVSRSIVAIRPHHQLRPGQVRRLPDWGQPVNDIQATGECVLVHPTMTIERQAELIVKKRPGYLLAKAANVDALVDHVAASGQPFDGLKQIRSFGEPVSYELRERARNTLGVEIADIYSATEIGMIAFQCREYGSYHIQCEGVRAEVVDDEDAPCPPGKEGRLLLTPLHHFAMPLLRCEIMDRVVQGQPCACGRGLVTIDAVIGRQRNMAVAPGGGRYWPSFPYARFSSIAPIKQIQLIQRTHASIEVHYQLQRPLDADESIALGKGLAAELGYVYQFTFVQHPEPIHDQSGKYQDFICLVDE
jgi:phenylacetate-CoA ligase